MGNSRRVNLTRRQRVKIQTGSQSAAELTCGRLVDLIFPLHDPHFDEQRHGDFCPSPLETRRSGPRGFRNPAPSPRWSRTFRCLAVRSREIRAIGASTSGVGRQPRLRSVGSASEPTCRVPEPSHSHFARRSGRGRALRKFWSAPRFVATAARSEVAVRDEVGRE